MLAAAWGTCANLCGTLAADDIDTNWRRLQRRMHTTAPAAAPSRFSCTRYLTFRSVAQQQLKHSLRVTCRSTSASDADGSEQSAQQGANSVTCGRRLVVTAAAVLALPMIAGPSKAVASPVGSGRGSGDSVHPKLTGLSTQQLADRIRDDFVNKQYYVTGTLTFDIVSFDMLLHHHFNRFLVCWRHSESAVLVKAL